MWGCGATEGKLKTPRKQLRLLPVSWELQYSTRYVDTTKYRQKILVGISFTVPFIAFVVSEVMAWRWAFDR